MSNAGFRPDEIDALLFAARADLETVNGAIEEFAGEDEALITAIEKLERMKSEQVL